MLPSLDTNQFYYQMEGKSYFLGNVYSYKVKFVNSVITVIEVIQINKTTTLSLPSDSVWRSDAKDNTNWSELNDTN